MKDGKIIIGFFGMEIFSENLGCVALTFSMTSLIKRIGKKINKPFEYYYFVRNRHGDIAELCRNVGISKKDVHVISAYNLTVTDIFMRNVRFKYYVNKCDLIIDMTQGDSFSDIYGYDRFNIWTAEKEWVLSKKIPLVLGPQTYGPFNDNNKLRAKKVIENAEVAIARDQFSYNYIKDFCTGNIQCSTDIAFILPYSKYYNNINKDKIVVGINVSGFLWDDNLEDTSKAFVLTAHYQDYVRRITNYFIARKDVEVVLTPHVRADVSACRKILEEYPQLKMVSRFANPIMAKSYIASYDFFIGARMHSTIAAISSGIPVIPVAYSRKFEGLYNTLDYNFIVDLVHLSTDDAVKMTKKFFEKRKLMQDAAVRATVEANHLINVAENAIIDVITKKLIE